MMMHFETLDVSSGSEDGDVPPADIAYAEDKLTMGDLQPVLFAKNRCSGLDDDSAKEHFQKCVRIAITKIKAKPNLDKSKIKAAAANIKRLNKFDWSEDGAWGLYWENLRLKRLRTRNQVKRLAEGEESLTESVKKARTAERRSNKDDIKMQDLLSSGAWKLVPTSLGPKTPLVSVLEQISQTLKPHAPFENHFVGNRQIPQMLAKSYAALNDQRFAATFPEHCSHYLGQLFAELDSQKVEMWEEIIAKLELPEDETNAKLLQLVQKTFAEFPRAFCRDDNPLKNASTLEANHLQQFVHPIFREAMFRFGRGAVWHAGGISHEFFVEREKADGVATVPGRNNIPLAYFEGARPIATQRKKKQDSEKIARNLVSALAGSIESLGRQQRRVPDVVRVYGAQSAGQHLVVSVLEHHGRCLVRFFREVRSAHRLSVPVGGTLFLHQVDQASVPVQTHDVLLFAELYACIASLAVSKVAREPSLFARERGSRKHPFRRCTLDAL
ncbi:hypothetical protein HDU86_005266 [Geranomyces michiganensis]|nr:hypothetical protein HDU86_005266 [Geranomyces michiganensis]